MSVNSPRAVQLMCSGCHEHKPSQEYSTKMRVASAQHRLCNTCNTAAAAPTTPRNSNDEVLDGWSSRTSLRNRGVVFGASVKQHSPLRETGEKAAAAISAVENKTNENDKTEQQQHPPPQEKNAFHRIDFSSSLAETLAFASKIRLDAELDSTKIIPGRQLGQTDPAAFQRLVIDRAMSLCSDDDRSDAEKLWKTMKDALAVLSESYPEPEPSPTDGVIEWDAQANFGILMNMIMKGAALLHISPHYWADQAQVPRRAALRQFINAVRAGAMQLHFVRWCHGCNGGISDSSDIAKVRTNAAICAACGTKNDAASTLDDLAAYFEMPNEASYMPCYARMSCVPGETFMNNCRGMFCAGLGSRMGRHRAKITLPAEPGEYESVCPLSATVMNIRVVDGAAVKDAKKRLLIKHSDCIANEGFLDLDNVSNEFELTVDADMDSCVVVMFIKKDPKNLLGGDLNLDQMTTAAHLLATPEFCTYFPRQLVTADQHLSMRSAALVFTDIADSTAMYSAIGDTEAIKVVQNHFRICFAAMHGMGGRVIKTVGDAIFAVFVCLEDAVAACTRCIMLLDADNSKLPQEHKRNRAVRLKIGVHVADVLTVPLNGINDFFGNGVNLAARVQSKAAADEIVVSTQSLPSGGAAAFFGNAVAKDPRRYDVLAGLECQKEETVSLKGIVGGVGICRFKVGLERS